MTNKSCYDRVIDRKASAENLKDIRKARDLSAKEVQSALGHKTYSSIYKWETANPFPETKNLAKLIKIYNVRFCDVLPFKEGDQD